MDMVSAELFEVGSTLCMGSVAHAWAEPDFGLEAP